MSIDRGTIGRANRADRVGVWVLIGIAIASTLVYALGITARYPLAIGLRSVRAGWATLVERSITVGVGLAGVYALLIVGYVVALQLILQLQGRNPRRGFGIIVAGWLLSSAALLGAYPGESFDIFDYVFRGRMIVEYGASPLATAPAAFQNQPFYNYITWRGQVDTYGPLWEYTSGAVAWAVHYVFGRADSHVAYIFGYRLLAMFLTGLCGLLIALIVRRSAPQLLHAALLAWLWNPLVLITSAIGAHNDLLMLVALLATLLLFQRQRWVWGLLALALAAHVKLTALLVLPILGLWLVRRCGWVRTLRICALALVVTLPLSWLLYAPFGGWVTLRRMLQERARLLINSPADLVYRLLQERFGWSELEAWRTTTQAATLAFFAMAAGILAWFWWADRRAMMQARLSPAPSPDEVPNGRSAGEVPDALLWRGAMVVTLAYLLVGSFWFQHWYLLWVLAPAVLLPDSRWTLTLLPAYCLGALWSNLTNSFVRNQPGYLLNDTQVGAINGLAQVAPLLCVLLVTRIWHDAPRLLAAARRVQAASRSTVASMAAAHEMDHRS
ncbi:MAG TPA: glycosyltransferase 87 family protein [Roseiflexaceae bacterium]|nr:glycosyltransferase 87 family protein [Roseiflexaceae bacterium]